MLGPQTPCLSASSRVKNSVSDTGTPAWRRLKKNETNIVGRPALAASASGMGQRVLGQEHILLALEQRPGQRWQELAAGPPAHRLGRRRVIFEQLQPIEQL